MLTRFSQNVKNNFPKSKTNHKIKKITNCKQILKYKKRFSQHVKQIFSNFWDQGWIYSRTLVVKTGWGWKSVETVLSTKVSWNLIWKVICFIFLNLLLSFWGELKRFCCENLSKVELRRVSSGNAPLIKFSGDGNIWGGLPHKTLTVNLRPESVTWFHKVEASSSSKWK